MLAPWDDPDFTLYGLNRGYVFQPRADVWFETHSQQIYKWPIRRPKGHLEWLKRFPGPVYLHDVDPEIPNSVAYPLAEVSEDVGVNVARLMKDTTLEPMTRNPYLTSSIAYQLALAIHEGFSEIHLYGIDLNTDGEYAWQKPGVEFLIGVAAGRGIKVVVPDDCALLKGKLYGRGFKKQEGEAVSVSQYEIRLKAVRKEREDLVPKIQKMQGAMEALNWVMENMPPGIDSEKMSERVREMAQQVDQGASRLNQLVGSEKEILYWISMTPEGQSGREAITQLETARAQRSDGLDLDEKGNDVLALAG